MPDWITQMRAIYRARRAGLPVGAGEFDSDALICVWRLEGTRRGGSRDIRFTLDLLAAPAPDGRNWIPIPSAIRNNRLTHRVSCPGCGTS